MLPGRAVSAVALDPAALLVAGGQTAAAAHARTHVPVDGARAAHVDAAELDASAGPVLGGTAS